MRKENRLNYDYTLLSNAIHKKCSTYAELARHLGWSDTVLSQKLNGWVDFTKKDIFVLCKALAIPKEMIGDYFFTLKKDNDYIDKG